MGTEIVTPAYLFKKENELTNHEWCMRHDKIYKEAWEEWWSYRYVDKLNRVKNVLIQNIDD